MRALKACGRAFVGALAGAVLVVGMWAQTARPEKIEKRIAPNVVLFQEIWKDSPLTVQGLRITPSRSVRLQAILGEDVVMGSSPLRGRELTSRAVWRHRALAGINADFFPYTGDPLGLCIVGGELVSEPFPNRPAVGWTPSGRIVMGTLILDADITLPNGTQVPLLGLNRPAKASDDVVLNTAFFGATAQAEAQGVAVVLEALTRPIRAGTTVTAVVREVRNANSAPIPFSGGVLMATGIYAGTLSVLQPGNMLRLRIDLRGEQADLWREVQEAVAGGPWLLRDGQVVPAEQMEQAGFNRANFIERRHPRTAVGRTAQGEVIWLTIDGRQPHSQGATLPELAELMRRYGAVEAINLDGGGSTTLVVRNLIVNSPSDGAERPVANAWLLFDNSLCPLPTSQEHAIEPSHATLKIGEQIRFRIYRNKEPISTWEVVWGTPMGLGFIDQWGRFTALRAGQGVVGAYVDGQWLYARVTVQDTVPPTATENGNENRGAGGNRTHE
ncbi:MAG: hypothetical protein C4337_00335 [Armatimonadota bacterium]